MREKMIYALGLLAGLYLVGELLLVQAAGNVVTRIIRDRES